MARRSSRGEGPVSMSFNTESGEPDDADEARARQHDKLVADLRRLWDETRALVADGAAPVGLRSGLAQAATVIETLNAERDNYSAMLDDARTTIAGLERRDVDLHAVGRHAGLLRAVSWLEAMAHEARKKESRWLEAHDVAQARIMGVVAAEFLLASHQLSRMADDTRDRADAKAEPRVWVDDDGEAT